MPLFTTLLVVLIVARVAGEAAERLGQPAMIGEILAGILLGPSVLDAVHVTPALQAIADLGVFLLVLLAGMEMEVAQLADASKGRGVWVSILGFVTPMILGAALGALYVVFLPLAGFAMLFRHLGGKAAEGARGAGRGLTALAMPGLRLGAAYFHRRRGPQEPDKTPQGPEGPGAAC